MNIRTLLVAPIVYIESPAKTTSLVDIMTESMWWNNIERTLLSQMKRKFLLHGNILRMWHQNKDENHENSEQTDVQSVIALLLNKIKKEK